MKTEWLVTNVIAVGSSGRAERAILGVILVGPILTNSGRICGPVSHFVVSEPPLEH